MIPLHERVDAINAVTRALFYSRASAHKAVRSTLALHASKSTGAAPRADRVSIAAANRAASFSRADLVIP